MATRKEMIVHAALTQLVRVFAKNALVPVLLHVRQTDEQLGLLLGGEGARHILLHTPEHKGTQNSVQLLDHVVLTLLPCKVLVERD